MAAISVGSVSVDVVPSVRGFARQLRRELVPDAARVGEEIGREIAAGIRSGIGDPISGPLDESARRQQRQAPRQGDAVAGAFAKGFQKRLKAAFESLPKANIDADASAADREIADLRARMEALTEKTIGVDLDADEALTEIEQVRARLEALNRDTARIDVRADTAAALTQLAAVQAEANALDGRQIDVAVSRRSVSSLDSAALSIRDLTSAVVAFAPVAVPAAAAASVGIGALASTLTGAGIAAGGFGLIAIPMFKKVSEAQKKAATAMTAFNKATTDKQREAALAKMKASLDSLTPAEKRLNTAVTGLEKSWKQLNLRVQPDVIRGLLPWIGALKTGMGTLEPVIAPASDAIELLGNRAKTALGSPYWRNWFRVMGVEGATALVTFGTAAGNVTRGISQLLLHFIPAGRQVSSIVLELSERFNAWASSAQASQSIKNLISYVQVNGPPMVATLVRLAGTITNILVALAPLAPVVLGVTSTIAGFVGWVAKTHPEVLRAAYALFIITKAYKLIGAPILAAVRAGALLIAGFRGQAVAANTANLAAVRYGTGLRSMAAAQIGANAATISSRAALLGLASILAKVAVVFAASPLVGKLERSLLGSAQSTRELNKAMQELGRSGKFTGALVDEFKGKLITARSSVQVFKNEAKELVDPNPIQLFNHAMSQALSILPGVDSTVGRLRDKFKSMDTTLAQMVQSGQTQQAAAAFGQLRTQLQQAGLKTDQINKLFPQYTAAARTAAASSNQLSTAVNNTSNALEGFYNPSIAVFNAVTRLKQGYNELVTALRSAKGGFSGNSAASQQLRQAFAGQLDAVAQLHQATVRKTGSEAAARAETQKQLPILYALAGRNQDARAQVDALARATGTAASAANTSKSAFVAQARQMGINKDRAAALWSQFLKTSGALDVLARERRLKMDITEWNRRIAEGKANLKSVPPEKRAKILAEIKDLLAKVATAKRELAGLKDKTVTINEVTRKKIIGPGPGHGQAAGGIYGPGMVRRYAKGDLEKARPAAHGIPANITDSPVALYGEAGPEAYIPLDPSRRARSVEILSRVADMFGLAVVRKAAGGITAMAAGAAPTAGQPPGGPGDAAAGYKDLTGALRGTKTQQDANTSAAQRLQAQLAVQVATVKNLNTATTRQTRETGLATAATTRQLPQLATLAARNRAARADTDALSRATATSTGRQNTARTAFASVATQMGTTRARTEALWREYGKLPAHTSSAAGGVESFRSRTNSAIAALKGKNLKVIVTADGKFTKASALAAGGPVLALAPGANQRRDSQPAMLRVNEHVWTPEEVSAAGGHGAVAALRAAALAGRLPGYAVGGAVSFASKTPSAAQAAAAVRTSEQHMQLARAGQAAYEEAKSLAAVWKKYAADGGPVVAAARSQIGLPYSWGGGGKGGPSYGIGRGARTFGFDCSGLTEFAWWRGRHVSIGGTTGPQHAGSHAISGPRPGALGFPHSGHVMLGSNKPGYVIQAPRTGGHVEEVRRSAGDWRWPAGAGLARGGPVTPVEASLGRKFTQGAVPKALIVEAKVLQLAGDPGGIVPAGMWRRFDSGGLLPPGPSLVYNGTGSAETVLTGRQAAALGAAAEGGGKTVNVMPNSTVYVQDPVDVDALAQRQDFAARAATF